MRLACYLMFPRPRAAADAGADRAEPARPAGTDQLVVTPLPASGARQQATAASAGPHERAPAAQCAAMTPARRRRGACRAQSCGC